MPTLLGWHNPAAGALECGKDRWMARWNVVFLHLCSRTMTILALQTTPLQLLGLVGLETTLAPPHPPDSQQMYLGLMFLKSQSTR